MSSRIRRALAGCVSIGLVVLLAAPSLPRAQQLGADARPFKPEELEQIVAPLALYPDPLVAQSFMASTYPLEVIQARSPGSLASPKWSLSCGSALAEAR